MVTFADLKSARPGGITDTAAAYRRLARHLDNRLEGIRGTGRRLGDAWTGEDEAGGTAAVEAVRGQYLRVQGASQGLDRISGHLTDLATAVSAAQEQLTAAVDSVSGFGLISEDGRSIRLDVAALKAKGVTGDQLPQYTEKLRTAAVSIKDALRKATEADETARTSIAALVPEPDDAPTTTPDIQLPEADWSVQQVNDWWSRLTPAQRESLLLSNPELIGPLDGVPAEYRDLANRTLLSDHLADAEAALAADPDNEELQDRVDALTGIADRLDRPSGTAGYDDRAYLLLIDPTDDGKAVVSVGNPDLADNTFTFVPGTGADLGTAEGDIGRVDRMVADANLRDPDASTAGIMWLGYDAPDKIVNAAFPSYAEDAAGDLQRFQSGLDVTHHGDGLNTMVGHSYGTTVIGHTATADGGVVTDQIVLVASPGTGTGHASDLGIGAENVYATTAPNDIIHLVPDWGIAHDVAPVMEEYGAQVFDSPRYDGSRVEAHSGYWDDGNPTRDNIAAIVTGHGDEVPRGDYHRRWYQWRPWD